jgi:hypothetical protein
MIYDKIRKASRRIPNYNDKQMAQEFNDHLKQTINQLSHDVQASPDDNSQRLAVFQAKSSLAHLIHEKFVLLI